MRRVVVTPTFAAGLGVVVAAVLAYPMQTAFNYVTPNAGPCRGAMCGEGSTQNGGEPASVPGNQLSTPGPSATHASDKRSGPAARTGRRTGAGGHTAAVPPDLSYQTSSRWRWGYEGTIVIRFRSRSAHGNWRLRFGYPSAEILRVWGAGGYLSHGTQSVVVASSDWPSQDSSGGLLRISIAVTGHPGPPHWCLFNNLPCHFRQRRGYPQGPAGGGTGHEDAVGGGLAGRGGSALPGAVRSGAGR